MNPPATDEYPRLRHEHRHWRMVEVTERRVRGVEEVVSLVVTRFEYRAPDEMKSEADDDQNRDGPTGREREIGTRQRKEAEEAAGEGCGVGVHPAAPWWHPQASGYVSPGIGRQPGSR